MRKSKWMYPLLLVSAVAVAGCGDNNNEDGGTNNDASASTDAGVGDGGGGGDGAVADGGGDAGRAGDGGGDGGGQAFTDGEALGLLRVVNDSEIAQAQLAMSRGTNVGVQRYAEWMIGEHTRANNDLTQLATAIGVTPVQNAFTQQLQAQSQSTLQALQSAQAGNNFDLAYLDAQVAAHQQLFQLIDSSLVPSASAVRLQGYLLVDERPEILAHYHGAQALRAIIGSNSNALSDSQVATLITVTNQAEIDQGTAAAGGLATDANVIAFANRMRTEHTAVGTRFQAVIAPLNLTPNASSSLLDLVTAQSQMATQEFNAASKGLQFDRTYIDWQVVNHIVVLTLIDTWFTPSAQAVPLKNFITNELRPAIVSHVTAAEQVESNLPTYSGP